jgi:mitochondrial import inner membrane translocase subunit TIM9
LKRRRRHRVKKSNKLYSSLVERCFTDCVNDFTSNAINTKEETCITRCVEKFLKHSERVGQRFQEQNAALMQGKR